MCRGRFYLALTLSLASAARPVAPADVVLLANGASLDGQVIRDTPRDPLVVVNTGGKLTYLNRAELSSIKLDDDGRAEYARRAAAIKDLPTDKTAQRAAHAAAHFELYTWAKAQHLYDYADQELMATLAVDPAHAAARQALAATKAQPAAAKPALSATAPVSAGATDDELGFAIIAPRYEIVGKPGGKPSSSSDLLAKAKILMSGERAGDEQRKAALQALSAEAIRAREVFLSSLDPSQAPAAETRLAALTGIEALNPVSTDVSNALVTTTIDDPEKEVRARAVAVIKARHDGFAIGTLTNVFLASFADDGQIKNQLVEHAAGDALRAIDDKRVYQALLYYATLEIRTQNTKLNAFVTRQIDSFTVLQGAQANVLVRLSFPIQFPELQITSVKTTVKAPAAAMSALSGMNFGNDVEAWAKWVRQR
jgi:hypothetical protein